MPPPALHQVAELGVMVVVAAEKVAVADTPLQDRPLAHQEEVVVEEDQAVAPLGDSPRSWSPSEGIP
jgi:hypothetical protein